MSSGGGGAAGGIFKLIANDGKADRMIMATELLNQRIKDIMCLRAKQGIPDPTPTLVDIERTHILFVNAHFKPFAAIGYEYMSTRANSGNAQFGGEAQFSIPQFGDFFYDMVVHMTLPAFSAVAGTVPAFPADIGNTPVGAGQSAIEDANLPGGAPATGSNQVTVYTYQYKQLDGTVLTPTVDAATNFVRYCEFPGQRLFSVVKFDVNGNPLDEYNSNVAFMYQKFRVQPNKQTGWARLVGQEVPVDAYSTLCGVAGTDVVPVNGGDPSMPFRDLVQNGTTVPAPVSRTTAALDTTNPDAPATFQNVRKLCKVVNGPQTPKATQPALDLWVPLLFWFNRDARLAVPSISIPYGQRFINIQFAPSNEVRFTAPGNLFLELTVENFVTSDGTVGGTGLTGYRKFVTREPVLALNSTITTGNEINNVELYINNIFVNPEIHDIYIKRIGFSLIRVHRNQIHQLTSPSADLLQSLFKWPIETIFAGIRPSYNVSALNPNQYRDWHRLTRLRDRECTTAVESSAPGGLVADASALAFGALEPTTCLDTNNELTYVESQKTIDSLHVRAHGISIYKSLNDEFFANYIPWHYGGTNVRTPEDEGALMINFCLYPGTYQPSGHINISRAREFYIEYVSSYVGAADTQTTLTAGGGPNSTTVTQAAQATLILVAIAINFLLISDGSAVLRYTT